MQETRIIGHLPPFDSVLALISGNRQSAKFRDYPFVMNTGHSSGTHHYIFAEEPETCRDLTENQAILTILKGQTSSSGTDKDRSALDFSARMG
jgi:hypothetical protein